MLDELDISQATYEYLYPIGDIECAFCPMPIDRDKPVTCIECGRVLCEEHTQRICTEAYCPECGVCRTCGSEALFACDKCSDLACPDHCSEQRDEDPITGYVDTYLTCCKCTDLVETRVR